MSYCFVDEEGKTRICDQFEDHFARGRCSGIPECCIRWYVETVLPSLAAGFDLTDPVEWGYRPCPDCVKIGRRVTVWSCARLGGAACSCGTFKNSRVMTEDEGHVVSIEGRVLEDNYHRTRDDDGDWNR